MHYNSDDRLDQSERDAIRRYESFIARVVRAEKLMRAGEPVNPDSSYNVSIDDWDPTAQTDVRAKPFQEFLARGQQEGLLSADSKIMMGNEGELILHITGEDMQKLRAADEEWKGKDTIRRRKESVNKTFAATAEHKNHKPSFTQR